MVNFNHDLYQKIREERRKNGLYVASLSEEIIDHEMKGKKFISKDDNKVYTVKAVYKQFYAGFFEMFMFINENGSSRPSYMKNINCFNDIIEASIKENQENFQLI
jgi:hypothetical protein